MMLNRKFAIGDTVRLVRGHGIVAALEDLSCLIPHRKEFPDTLGPFEIRCLLPPEHGKPEYHVTSLADGRMRVVMETEIA